MEKQISKTINILTRSHRSIKRIRSKPSRNRKTQENNQKIG